MVIVKCILIDKYMINNNVIDMINCCRLLKVKELNTPL